MGSKKRPSSSMEDSQPKIEPSPPPPNNDSDASKSNQEPQKSNLKPMERRKKRKALDKERQHAESEKRNEPNKKKKPESEKPTIDTPPSTKPISDKPTRLPSLHVNLFRDLASVDPAARKAAAEGLVTELIEVQRVYEEIGGEEVVREEGAAGLETEKDDGLENCAPSLRYAIRRLIRGVSSSRECARQGFALGLSLVLHKIPNIKVDSLMKLVVNLLEVAASMKGQEAKDCFLGRLFAYGALAKSGRIALEWRIRDKDMSSVKDFVSSLISLAVKKRYLREPAVSIIIDIAQELLIIFFREFKRTIVQLQLPLEAVVNHVLEVPGLCECFHKAANIGDPDALFLALKLHEIISMDSEIFGKLLPSPFTPENFFARDHLLYLVPCFKESTFCHPRIHSLWHLLANILVPVSASLDDAAPCTNSSKKHKKSRKGGSVEEEITKVLRSFCEVVIEESLLLSSHERKHLALMILLLLLPRIPASIVPVILSYKLVQCLMDILLTKGSYLHETAQYFMKELINWIGNDDDRCVSVIVALQKHSSGRFDSITKTQTVKGLVAKLNTSQGCLLFVHNLMSLFVDDGVLTDEPSDQSQTTDENSEMGSVEDKEIQGGLGNVDVLKNWIIDTMPRVLKNLTLNSDPKSLADTEIISFFKEKFRVQAEIMKFLAVQGLFSASLGTEVTSFELEEKFKWPRVAISSSLCKMCIEKLQLLLEDAQRGEVSNIVSNSLEGNDLGSYFMIFLKTFCDIPSVSIYRKLSEKDEKAFKKLQSIEYRLLQQERNSGSEPEANKLHTLRYVLIQLVLQVLLCPEEFFDAASELAICCKKAFPAAAVAAAHSGDSSEEENGFDDNEMPEMMDVLFETFLSLLPHSSGPMCFSIEQAFRLLCDDLTIDGLLRMLHVLRKDLKPLRHQTYSSDDDDDDNIDDDFLGIEDPDESNEAKATEAGNGDENADDSETEEKLTNNEEVDSEGMLGTEPSSKEEVEQDHSGSSNSDDDGDMDDDAMLKKDHHIAEILKQRLSSGKDSALSQLLTFKSRVLSLLEIFLQKNPGKSQVLMIYSYLVRAFLKYRSAKKTQLQQLGLRIRGILQKKIFKARDYPKGDDISLTSLNPLLVKSLIAASRSSHKEVSSLAQASTFWLVKVIQSRNFDKPELDKVVELFRHTLIDYFQSKKCRLKSGFVKEIIRRHPWLGHELFGFLLEKCGGAKSEFRRIEALEIVDCMMKSWAPTRKGEGDESSKSSSKLLKEHMQALCDLIQVLLSNLPVKQSRHANVRRFCNCALSTISTLNLKRSFLKVLKPEVYSLCETHLGDAFLPFK